MAILSLSFGSSDPPARAPLKAEVAFQDGRRIGHRLHHVGDPTHLGPDGLEQLVGLALGERRIDERQAGHGESPEKSAPGPLGDETGRPEIAQKI